MATQTENPDTLDLDSDRDARLMEAFIGLIEGEPDEIVHGWFTTADVQLAFFQEFDIEATPEEVRRTLGHFADGLQVDARENLRDQWALFDPQSEQSLLRLADAQSTGENFTTREAEYLAANLSRTIGPVDGVHEAPYFNENYEEEIRSLASKGILELDGQSVEWAGRLGEWCSMGGGESFFEAPPMQHGDYIPDADWGWRHGGIMYLSDSKLELQEKIRSVWAEHRRESPVPSPNPCEFASVLALAIDFDVELVPSEVSDWR